MLFFYVNHILYIYVQYKKNKIDIYMRDEFEENNISKEIYKLIEPSKSKIYLSSCENVCTTKQCIEFKKKFDRDIIHFEIGKEYKIKINV